MFPARQRRRLTRAARVLRGLAFAAFVAKALVPMGYMPGPIGDGSLVRLCDAGLPAAARAASGGLAAHTGHHDHASHASAAHGGGTSGDRDHALAWKYCPFGALAYASAIPVECGLPAIPPAAAALPSFDAEPRAGLRVAAFQPRAPPPSIAHV